jgi:DNA modification methylase
MEIYCGDCIKILEEAKWFCDGVITSPPYNLGKNPNHRKKTADDLNLYSKYKDTKTAEEYIEWMVTLFKILEERVQKRGVVCLNLSYSSKDASLPYRVVVEVEKRTKWKIRDTLFWKKPSAIPFQTSPCNLSRIVEQVFVFARESKFTTNKRVKSINERTGQKFFEYVDNFIEAPSHDPGTRKQHKATFSTDFVKALIQKYFPEGSYILDPFAGVGTTGKACKALGRKSILIELDEKYVKLCEEI